MQNNKKVTNISEKQTKPVDISTIMNMMSEKPQKKTKIKTSLIAILAVLLLVILFAFINSSINGNVTSKKEVEIRGEEADNILNILSGE